MWATNVTPLPVARCRCGPCKVLERNMKVGEKGRRRGLLSGGGARPAAARQTFHRRRCTLFHAVQLLQRSTELAPVSVHTDPQAIAPAWKDRVRFEKIDTEENPAVADAFQVHKLPTLILFRCGGVQGAAACTLS